MNFRPFLFIAFIAAASAGAFAQINPNYLSLRTEPAFGRASAVSALDSKSSSAALMSMEQDAFQLINFERGLAGLSVLKWNEKVAKVARLHSQNMVEHNFFSHKGTDGLMVDERADALGLCEWLAIGENIAFMKGYSNPSAVAVEKWLLSASHRNNLLNAQWTDSAVGAAITDDGKVYFTQVFLLRK